MSAPTQPASPKVDLLFFDAGGGHRSAATALKAAIESSGFEWDTRLVNLQEVLDPLDIFRKVTGVRLQDLYNRMLARGWTVGSAISLRFVQQVIRLYHKQAVKLLTEFWRHREPAMVVSLVPNVNRATSAALAQLSPCIPYVTILTDLADFPPHFWMEPPTGGEHHVICGSSRAVQQAAEQGYAAKRVHQVSGMILRSIFYREQMLDRQALRVEHGLDPNLLTAFVMFGGEGSMVMHHIAERLGNADCPLQIVLVCGKNERLRERLNKLKTRNRLLVLGFIKDVPRYMSLADLFIGKPGPGSISEALQMELPAIVEANAWTLPQERYNAAWLQAKGYGLVLRNFSNVALAVQSFTEGTRLAEMKARVKQFHNRAIFEIPPTLKTILEGSEATATSPEFPARDAGDSGG